jgi:hypothetical protein
MIGPDEMDLQLARAFANVYVRAMLAMGARCVHDNTTEFCKSYAKGEVSDRPGENTGRASQRKQKLRIVFFDNLVWWWRSAAETLHWEERGNKATER